jgi:5-oxoprolinase (ATP-hydrolysing) subunit C
MSPQIEVLDAGLGNCIQDGGRFGSRSFGVPVSGAADLSLLACANYLLNNDLEAPALEVRLSGPSLKAVSGTVRCAIVGGISARLLHSNGSVRAVGPWQTATLQTGDVIAVGSAKGLGYLAISGGFLVPPQLGSRSTFARAALGGMEGRALRATDRIACEQVRGDPWVEFRAGAPFMHPEGPLRVIAGPQEDYFTPASIDTFFNQPFEVTRELDRMGIRLTGPTLVHRPEKGADTVSDGITPGAIQVPANGHPIMLGPDCQTVGGYPKIATLISADLPRLAHLVPGQQIGFVRVDLAQAREALRQTYQALLTWRVAILTFRPPGVIDEQALYSENLVSGMTDARGFFRGTPIDFPWELQ